MIVTPSPLSPQEQALASIYREEITGIASASQTLSYPVAQTQDGKNLLLLVKNGVVLPEIAGATGYSVTGKAITLGTAAGGGDRFVAFYFYRAGV